MKAFSLGKTPTSKQEQFNIFSFMSALSNLPSPCSHYCLQFTMYPCSLFSWHLFTLTYHWICLGRFKYPPHSVLQFAFSCFPDVLEIFPHRGLYVCRIHRNGCLIATGWMHGALHTRPPLRNT